MITEGKQKKRRLNYLQDIILEKEGTTTGVLLPVCL